MYGLFLDISVLFLGRVLDGSEVRNPEALTLFILTLHKKLAIFRGLCLLTGVTKGGFSRGMYYRLTSTGSRNTTGNALQMKTWGEIFCVSILC